ncbi:MAG TPA: hypothetical protein PLY66_11110 [Acidobacteriota bacterium]|nr:hypothetical protein [Acidobacteriota bacterium]HOT01545.1 hypothetical protein [Acidobacteriota bacterium]HQF87430.1 hypothetical protein [Acidobacteriota bacterium]HQG92004.1 hypothetical protein [Acidobacteriota bacterium]HQK87469.1 hypothetical protein [Acidobacteriota bacterium]
MNVLQSFGPVLATAGPALVQPAPYWLLTALHWLTFTLHLVAMNLLFGLLLVLLLARRHATVRLLEETAIKIFPVAMAATITLGVAPLLFTQVVYGEFFYAATIISGWNWFLQIPVVMVVYYLLYIVALRKNLSAGVRRGLLAAVAVGFVYISYTFTMISDLAEKPALWAGLYRSSPEGGSLNPHVAETICRWGHSIAGAVAVAGIMILWFALFHPQLKGRTDLLALGGRVFVVAAVKATILSLIYLALIDRTVLGRYLESPALHALVTAIVLNVAAGVLAWRVRHAARPLGHVLAASGLVFLGVACMVAARHHLRLVYLRDAFDPAVLAVIPQWGPLAMFLVTFVIGLVVLYWMLRRFFSAPHPA